MPVSYGPEKEDAEKNSEGRKLVERKKKDFVGEIDRTIASEVKVFIEQVAGAEDWRFLSSRWEVGSRQIALLVTSSLLLQQGSCEGMLGASYGK